MTRNVIMLLLLINNVILITDYSKQNDQKKSNFKSLRMTISEEIVQQKVNYYYRHVMKISIGSPFQDLKVKLSTSFCGLWIQNIDNFKNGFNSSESSTFISSTESGAMEDVTGKIVRDTIEFVQLKVENYPFLYVNLNKKNEQNNFQGVIGFGYHCNQLYNAENDILSYLIKSRTNKLNLFYFRINSQDEGGWFFIGGYPDNYNKYAQYYRKTPVDKKNTNGQWKVLLDSIYFEDGEIIKIKDRVSIGIGGSILSVTKEVFLKVANKYFHKEIISNQCVLNDEGIYEIICDINSPPPDFGYISFIVGKWNFKIKSSKLFKEINRKGEKIQWFAMVHYPEHNEFYISQFFLRGISIVYDKEKGELGYFDKE